jgi:hypothetical protein
MLYVLPMVHLQRVTYSDPSRARRAPADATL